MPQIKIGALAKLTNTSAPTIRYYEQIGLLPKPSRQSGSQRVYDDADSVRLMFIRRCRDLGFPIDAVRNLAALMQDRGSSCTEARDLAARHLDAVRLKQQELVGLALSLESFVRDCNISCLGGPGPECVIIATLGQAPARSICCG